MPNYRRAVVAGGTFFFTLVTARCCEKLAGYKVPREIRAIEELPRNPTGKIMRRELKV